MTAAERFLWIQARELGLYFSYNVIETLSYGLKFLGNVHIKPFFDFKENFPVSVTFYATCLPAFESALSGLRQF